MADEDACQCVWSHEYAMQRLINFIRQNQNACTDTECFDVSGRDSQTSEGGSGNFTVAVGFMILAMFLYVMNPSTWTQWSNATKPNRDDTNNQGGSPPPPQPPPPPTAN